MAEPRISEKRWTIDLEKRIQEEHYADKNEYDQRYGFKPNSGKELFVIDTPSDSLTLIAFDVSALIVPEFIIVKSAPSVNIVLLLVVVVIVDPE